MLRLLTPIYRHVENAVVREGERQLDVQLATSIRTDLQHRELLVPDDG